MKSWVVLRFVLGTLPCICIGKICCLICISVVRVIVSQFVILYFLFYSPLNFSLSTSIFAIIPLDLIVASPSFLRACGDRLDINQSCLVVKKFRFGIPNWFLYFLSTSCTTFLSLPHLPS